MAPGDSVCTNFILGDAIDIAAYVWLLERYVIEGYESHSFGYLTMIIRAVNQNVNIVMKHNMASGSDTINLPSGNFQATRSFYYPVDFDTPIGSKSTSVAGGTPLHSLTWYHSYEYAMCIQNVAIPGYYDNPIYYRAVGTGFLGQTP